LDNKKLHISFFKPTTTLAKKNRNIVIILVSIWFISIFGFQILLKLVEKPSPEKDLAIFERAWAMVKSGLFLLLLLIPVYSFAQDATQLEGGFKVGPAIILICMLI